MSEEGVSTMDLSGDGNQLMNIMSQNSRKDVFLLTNRGGERAFLDGAAAVLQETANLLGSVPPGKKERREAMKAKEEFLESVCDEGLWNRLQAQLKSRRKEARAMRRAAKNGEGSRPADAARVFVDSTSLLRAASYAVHRVGGRATDMPERSLPVTYDPADDVVAYISPGEPSFNRLSALFTALPQPVPTAVLFADAAAIRVDVLAATLEERGGELVGLDGSAMLGSREDDMTWVEGRGVAKLQVDAFVDVLRESGGFEGLDGVEEWWLDQRARHELLNVAIQHSILGITFREQFGPEDVENGMWKVSSLLDEVEKETTEKDDHETSTKKDDQETSTQIEEGETAEEMMWTEITSMVGSVLKDYFGALQQTVRREHVLGSGKSGDPKFEDVVVEHLTQLRLQRALRHHVATFELSLDRFEDEDEEDEDEEVLEARREAAKRAKEEAELGLHGGPASMPRIVSIIARSFALNSGLVEVPPPLVPRGGWRLVNFDEALPRGATSQRIVTAARDALAKKCAQERNKAKEDESHGVPSQLLSSLLVDGAPVSIPTEDPMMIQSALERALGDDEKVRAFREALLRRGVPVARLLADKDEAITWIGDEEDRHLLETEIWRTTPLKSDDSWNNPIDGPLGETMLRTVDNDGRRTTHLHLKASEINNGTISDHQEEEEDQDDNDEDENDQEQGFESSAISTVHDAIFPSGRLRGQKIPKWVRKHWKAVEKQVRAELEDHQAHTKK